MAIRGIAARVAQAKARGGGNFLNPGEGELVILAIKDGTKPEFYEGDTFVAELKVEKCTPFPGQKNKEGQEKPAGNAVGSVVSYVQQFQTYPDVAFTNVKTFLMALAGETDESLAASAAETAKLLAAPDCDPGFKQNATRIMQEAGVQAWNADCEFSMAYESFTDRKKNPGRGMRLKYSTYEKESRKGEMLTLPRWEPVKQTADEIAAKRAQLDSAAPTAEQK